ncbi:hypothetical protein ACNJNU_26545 [Citrobacter freundii]|uniref:hypothetical protein n=1 Tax=Citrobacter freundii TaxID=546 RepID=UPI003A88778E
MDIEWPKFLFLIILIVILNGCLFFFSVMKKDSQDRNVIVPQPFSEDAPPVMGEWEKCAYPLTQVIVSVNAQPHTITRDLVFCLERAADSITNNELPVDAEGCHYRGDYGNTGLTFPEYSAHWHVHVRLCFDPPGFSRMQRVLRYPPGSKWLAILLKGVWPAISSLLSRERGKLLVNHFPGISLRLRTQSPLAQPRTLSLTMITATHLLSFSQHHSDDLPHLISTCLASGRRSALSQFPFFV